MPPKKMLSTLFILNGGGWSVLAFAGAGIFFVLGFIFDFRFFILSLIWIFLFLPLVVAFLYFYYGMKPLTAFNTVPHTLKLDNQFLQINFTLQEKEGINENKFYKTGWSLFREIKTGSQCFLLCFNTLGWLWLPLNAFATREDLDKFLNLVESKNPLKNESK